jgi:hypothetical protein
MKKQDYILVANIALAQKRHKQAAVQTHGEDSQDKHLEGEVDKMNEGGTPAAATDATGHSNAATFDTKPNTKKPSNQAPGLKVSDNENLSPRKHTKDKQASLADLLKEAMEEHDCKCGKSYKGKKCPGCGEMYKEAAAANAGDGNDKLEAESKKLVTGGDPAGDVEHSSVSEDNPDPVSKGGEKTPSGDVNDNLSPRHHTNKTASEITRNALGIRRFLSDNKQALLAR